MRWALDDIVRWPSINPNHSVAKSIPTPNAFDGEINVQAYRLYFPKCDQWPSVATNGLEACDAMNWSVKLDSIEFEIQIPLVFLGGWMCEAFASFAGDSHGFVTDIPYILPGGNVSIDLPVSFEANRIAIASSTACCLFNATYERDET